MNLKIRDKTAFVMGGSRGIGRAISNELAQAGCKVAVVARGAKDVESTVEELRKAGGQAMGITADLADLSAYEGVVEQIRKQFGAPDIAVFNLREPKTAGFDEVDEADFAEAYHLVVLCLARLIRVVVPAMKEKRWGRIVVVGSSTAKMPHRTSHGYSVVLANSTRVGAVGLVKTLAYELGPFGITLNTIGTGNIGTEYCWDWNREQAALKGLSVDQFVDDVVYPNIAARRFGTPDEMAALCAFLCSDRSGYTTGETILCDGGLVNCMP